MSHDLTEVKCLIRAELGDDPERYIGIGEKLIFIAETLWKLARSIPKRSMNDAIYPGENCKTRSDYELRTQWRIRRGRMAEMRKGGMTYREIGSHFGVSGNTVRGILMAQEGRRNLISKPQP